jgi:uncharacterized RDD family membrane protein YckC
MSRKQIPFFIALALFLYSFGWLVYEVIQFSQNGFGFFANNIPYAITFTMYTLLDFAGLAGIIVYASSGYRNNSLLRFYLAVIAFQLASSLLFNTILFTLPRDLLRSGYVQYLKEPKALLFNLLLPALQTGLAIWAMILLRGQRTPRIVTIPGGEQPVYTFAFVGKGLRFCNLLIDDLFLILFILSKIYILNLFNSDFGDDWLASAEIFGSVLFSFVVMIFRLIYYLFHEGIFNTTPGKIVTGSAIITENGSRPHFGQILGRTFSRIIPFEPLIYLFIDRPLHDSLPETWVVEETNKED